MYPLNKMATHHAYWSSGARCGNPPGRIVVKRPTLLIIVEIYKIFFALHNSLKYETVLSSYFNGVHGGWAFYSIIKY